MVGKKLIMKDIDLERVKGVRDRLDKRSHRQKYFFPEYDIEFDRNTGEFKLWKWYE